MGNFLLLLLYLGCTTNQRSIPFGNGLRLLVQDHQGSFCGLESSQLKKLMEEETEELGDSKDTWA